MCLKLFWSKKSSRDGGRDFSPEKNKVPDKPLSVNRDDIEKETSTNYPYYETPPKSDYAPSPSRRRVLLLPSKRSHTQNHHLHLFQRRLTTRQKAAVATSMGNPNLKAPHMIRSVNQQLL
ncbi:hypothetical protein QJS10_CPA03g00584 [Acorus calamus]|uniref:Uncharacterized protein n=1 Tax=Acorus calamus TaxID=4465 RepID=A0AAV9FAL7_ACOCL|nr:hypothetical protein QJS10_CPA03g00584 [Acorus calamus]